MRGRYGRDGQIEQHFEARSDKKGNALTTATKNSYVADPDRFGDIGTTAQAHRVYSCDGKSVIKWALQMLNITRSRLINT